MRRILLATRNPGKLREVRQLLPEVSVLGLDDFEEIAAIEETGTTFAENAVIKARAGVAATGIATIADDSGLEVDALDGRPGVWSARFAGEQANAADNNALLLRELADVPTKQRTARFRCAIVYLEDTESDPLICEASCEGRILDTPRGAGGFGYDPLFFVEELGQTFAEAKPADKHRLSHRGKALALLVAELDDRSRD